MLAAGAASLWPAILPGGTTPGAPRCSLAFGFAHLSRLAASALASRLSALGSRLLALGFSLWALCWQGVMGFFWGVGGEAAAGD